MVADQEALYYISAERCYIQPNSVTSTLLLEDDY